MTSVEFSSEPWSRKTGAYASGSLAVS